MNIDDLFDDLHKLLNTRFDGIDRKLESMMKLKDAMNGDKLLDNQDLCLLFGVTKRSLARYRKKELIRYYMVDGKAYYKASEIQEFLKEQRKR